MAAQFLALPRPATHFYVSFTHIHINRILIEQGIGNVQRTRLLQRARGCEPWHRRFASAKAGVCPDAIAPVSVDAREGLGPRASSPLAAQRLRCKVAPAWSPL